jgi:hypothetical protein
LKRGLWKYVPEERVAKREAFKQEEAERKQFIQMAKQQNEQARQK